MASAFPTALTGAKTDYDNADEIASADQNSQSEDINALAAKVGIDSSAVTTSHDYKLSGITGSEKAGSEGDLTTHAADTTTHGATGAVVGTTNTQTLTNKTIDGDDNTVQDLGYDTIKSTSRSGSDATLITGTKGTASDLSIWNADGDLVDGPTPPTGTIVGTTDTQTLTNKTLSTGCAVDASADENLTGHSVYRQAIINGNFDVWQRSTTAAWNSLYHTADRWRGTTTGAVPVGTISQQTFTVGQTDVPNNPTYHIRSVVTDVNSATVMSIGQRIEKASTLSGGNITISFWAKSDAASGDTITTNVWQNFGSGGSGSVETNGTAHNLTDSWTKFTETITIPSISGKTVGAGDHIEVQFMFILETHTIDIAQVQVCEGDVALPFQPKSYGDELRACQRYCYVVPDDSISGLMGHGMNNTTTTARIMVDFPTTMRGVPTVTATAADYQLWDGVTVFDVTVLAMTATGSTKQAGRLELTSSGLTAYRPAFFMSDGNANRVMIFDAEL